MLPILLLAVLLAGCGGSGKRASHPSCAQRVRTRALGKLHRDLAALRKAAAIPTKNTLIGGPAVNRATDRFLHDLETSPLDNLTRNRMIDHGVAALLVSCQQCFQALEAERPIPAIAQGNKGNGAACPARH